MEQARSGHWHPNATITNINIAIHAEMEQARSGHWHKYFVCHFYVLLYKRKWNKPVQGIDTSIGRQNAYSVMSRGNGTSPFRALTHASTVPLVERIWAEMEQARSGHWHCYYVLFQIGNFAFAEMEQARSGHWHPINSPVSSVAPIRAEMEQARSGHWHILPLRVSITSVEAAEMEQARSGHWHLPPMFLN